MKKIEILDMAKNSGKSLNELGINALFYRAYINSRRAGNELINFSDSIWENDVKDIINSLK